MQAKFYYIQLEEQLINLLLNKADECAPIQCLTALLHHQEEVYVISGNVGGKSIQN